MANEYYNASGSPGVGSQGSSASIRAELLAAEVGFDRCPSLTPANAYIITNTAGTGFSALGRTVGTWTPTLTCNTPGNLTVAYTTRVGNYVRIGRIVYLTCSIVTSTFTHTTASGAIIITGIPVAEFTLPLTVEHQYLYGSGFNAASGGVYTQFLPDVINGAVSITKVRYNPFNIASLDITEFPTAGTVRLAMNLEYFAGAAS